MLKCLVWDLDNTLWNGILSEDYKVKININMLKLVKTLDSIGVLQSIASRNDETLVLEKLDELGIRKYFLYPCCNYNSKVNSLQKIAKNLNISIKSVGFIDDDPFEIYEVNRYLPDVCTFLVEDKEDILSHFENSTTFESKSRRKMMQLRENRLKKEKEFKGTREDFLKECEMKIKISEGTIDNIKRISELTVRTNKLNTTQKKLNELEIENILYTDTKKIYICELKDIFGYYGIVGVCILDIEENYNIELFCISCKVEGRGIGHAFLNSIIEMNNENDIYCKYIKNKENRATIILLNLVGFKIVKKSNYYSILKFNKNQKINSISWVGKQNDI